MLKLGYKILIGISIVLLAISSFSIHDSFGQIETISELFTKISSNNIETEFNLARTSSQDVSSVIIDSEIVSANISILDGDSITILLFDKTYTLTKEYIDTRGVGDFSWFGSNDLVSAIITVQENKLVATIHTPDGTFIVEPYTSDPLDDYHLIKNVDTSRLVEFPNAITPTLFGSSQSPHHNDDYYIQNIGQVILEHDRFRPSNLNDLEIVTVDVFVGYTEKVEDENGGANDVRRAIQNEIDSANYANRASNIPVNFNLSGSDDVRYGLGFNDGGEVTLDQDRSNLLEHSLSTLNKLRNDADDQNADILILLTAPSDINSYGGCGVAGDFIAKHPHDSIAVVVYDCFAGATFPHEMGHLFGAGHNRDFDGIDISPFGQFSSDGYGYYDANVNFRTIMSYDCDSTTVDYPDLDPPTPETCRVSEVWSDPEVDFFPTVTPAGNDDNYNARAIFGAGPYIASLQGGVEKYDSISPLGDFKWFDEFIDKIFNQGQTMSIRAEFNEAIHDGYPPTVTISDGTIITGDISMIKSSDTIYTTSHLLTTEEGTVTLEFSNAKDLYLNNIIPTATDNSGSVTVIQPDRPPVITLNPPNPQIIELGSGYTELGATTNDGSPVTIDASAFVDAIGSYPIYYDSVNVPGTVITLTGDNPQTIEIGSGYTELGATTNDGSEVTIDNTAFVDAIGSYSILYDSVDTLNNPVPQVSREVNVVDTDTTPPTIKSITVKDSKDRKTITILFNEPITVTNDSGFKIIKNNKEQNITSIIIDPENPKKILLTVNTNIQGAVKLSEITYNGTLGNISDVVGNSLSGFTAAQKNNDRFTISDVDITPPTIKSITAKDTEDRKTITILFNEPITVTDDSGFKIIKNNKERTITSILVDPENPKKILLTVNTNIQGAVKLSEITYNGTLGNISDVVGNSLSGFTAAQKNNDRFTILPENQIPVISLVESPRNVNLNDDYVDAGATAFTTKDSDITSNIITVNPVDKSVLGEYIITHNVADSLRASAIQVIRTVNVVDKTPLTISPISNTSLNEGTSKNITVTAMTLMEISSRTH